MIDKSDIITKKGLGYLTQHQLDFLRQESKFKIVAWLGIEDDTKIVIQTFNGTKRLNWVFNLNILGDRDALRDALGVGHEVPMLAALNGCEGKVFAPQMIFRSYP